MSQQYGLGRGLDALITRKAPAPIGEAPRSIPIQHTPATDESIHELPVEKIVANDYQPRVHFNDEELNELAESIREYGIIQPLVVSRDGDIYRLIAGERRLRASKLIGLAKVPVVLRDADHHQRLALALIENVQRVDLNPIELALGYKRLRDEFNLSQSEIGARVGKSRPSVANTLRMLNLPQNIRESLMKGDIGEGYGKVILAIQGEKQQIEFYENIVNNKWSINQASDYARTKAQTLRRPKNPELVEKEKRLRDRLGTRVCVTRKGERGTIEIEFYSDEQLNELVDLIDQGV